MPKLIDIPDVKMKHLDKLSGEQMAEVHRCFRYLAPSEKLGQFPAADIGQMPFHRVYTMRTELGDGPADLKAMSWTFNLSVEQVIDHRLTQYWPAYNWLRYQLESIEEREEAALHREPEAQYIEAGINELSRFGALNSLDRLAVKYHTSPQEVEQWPYDLVFALLWKATIHDDIDKALAEIQKRKSKKR